MSVLSASSLSASDISFTRRVKPLPKRRRTSPRKPEVESYIATADPPLTISTYYHPISSGRIDRLKQESNVTPPRSPASNKLSSVPAPSRVPDDADGEGDCTDHIQQPNNTKKRKVPAATVAVARGSAFMRDNGDLIDDDSSQDSRSNLLGKTMGDTGASTTQEFDYQPVTARRKQVSLVTVATLRLKELLRVRRKAMTAAICEDLDPLALEFALSVPFARPPTQPPLRAWSYGPKFRRRPLNRTTLSFQKEPCFSNDFTFSVPSPIGKRYSTAKKVASGLLLRFQAELARQATTAAEMALKSTSKTSDDFSAERRKVDSNSVHVPSNGSSVDVPSKKPKKPKKKKRSALANASNPHHLRNYVPSRVSHPGGHATSSGQRQSQSNNSLGPLPLKFLSATLSPRQKGRALTGENLGSNLVLPETEWICPFCEYNLFYGDEAALQRAIRSRRKILIRRRNARERAAAAASGGIASKNQDTSDDQDQGESEDDDESFGDCDGLAPDVSLPREVATTGVRQDDRGPHPGG
ncbi:unnamed protein product [Rhizoctonia solani]|uniref:Uncharacterized protein n=1 Tax=Rhizoctonia solani TaxID=456999 RepID=A0A8H2X565_9AGAM|nr:unnamed protein product [Rhizoctonia solani]